jgi:hypothetical protein
LLEGARVALSDSEITNFKIKMVNKAKLENVKNPFLQPIMMKWKSESASSNSK